MEPVTHFLTGACIGRAGLNRRTAYATLAATLAAEAPDMDVFWGVAGPVVSFAHHRGITHTFVAVPVVALVITGFVWCVDKAISSRRKPIRDPQPIRWLWVYFSAFIAALSHILLDWTNNYGVRPFFPFNTRWYSGDLVFIADPVLWALLLLAIIVPALLGLTDREVGAHRQQFRGRGWAIFALIGMVAVWGLRWSQHAKASNLVAQAQVTATPASRTALEPYPFSPFRWHALLETGTTWQTAEVDTRTNQVESDPRNNVLLKPAWTPAIIAARQSRLGQVYLDWSQWPVVRDIGPQAAPKQPPPDFPANRNWTTIEFSDLRFAYAYLDTSMGTGSSRPLAATLPTTGLAGWVYIVDGPNNTKEEAGQFIGGREQK
jgi:inner membrane protein